MSLAFSWSCGGEKKQKEQKGMEKEKRGEGKERREGGGRKLYVSLNPFPFLGSPLYF